jgi:hypothetical protein
MLRFFDVRVKIPKLLLGGRLFQIGTESLLIYQGMTGRGGRHTNARYAESKII